MHATEYLLQSDTTVPPVVALPGGQWHLKQQVIARLKTLVIADDETSLIKFTGNQIDLAGVVTELRTVSMWGDRRLVLVEDADDFVSKHRAAMEKYVEAPAKKSVLVLLVNSWPKTTRLAKLVTQHGLEVDCSELKGAALNKWLQTTSETTYQVILSRDAGALLIELIGEDLGMLDQELNKLAAFVGDRKKIAAEDVRGLVSGWTTETTWAMTDGIRDGRLPDALAALNDLLGSGEAAPKLLGGIGFVFRKLALATELARTIPLDGAIKQAGVFPRDAAAASNFLRRIGRAKAERILDALVAADYGVKGNSKLPDKLVLERLLLQLSGAI